ncbi:phosphate ABC transporter permease PstA [Nocardioides lianchengensis]|uniref:Phosphate transport system permease protein PstA n=1 Tax=Nocardioides lianchengensis TaxID=1045774 RepID=A0A1G6TIJ7_9ACTN|nr:phosphate ABC transporter permease PstA [Nocardioides lianchengensis]NYG11744.1 phosphate transport system permease protein [Nocardioides lianchengensis]SDD28839.1 phosphate transport system permease protein [Nocardioides lianchengensis]
MTQTATRRAPAHVRREPVTPASVPPAPRPPVPPVVEDVRRPSGRTREDLLSVVGAGVASLATTWLFYTRILPFDGSIGFVVLWYVVFVLFYAGLTALTQPRQVVVDRIVTTAVIAAPSLIALALASVVVMTVVKGLPALTHWNFYTEDMAGVRANDSFSRGGILHALVGTLIEVAIAVSIAMPLGVATAVYISEVGGRGAELVRTVVEAMTALPSIVAGLFIYTICLVYLGMPTSGLAAALALAVMALPIMARASYVVLGVVPGGLREASYALGAGKWQTVWRVVLPTARPGLATALILGIARAVGETAPVLLTSGASTYFNANPVQDPMNSLPLYIYAAVQTGNPQMEERAYAAAAVLLAVVLTLFVLARLVAGGRKSR